MPKKLSILLVGANRGLSLKIAGAMSSGVYALDSALRKLGARDTHADARLDQEARRFARRLGELKGSYVKIGQLLALLGSTIFPAPLPARSTIWNHKRRHSLGPRCDHCLRLAWGGLPRSEN